MLPANFSNYDSYFEESLRYMNDYKWLYNFAVTDVLVEDVLSRIPSDWLSALMQLTNDELNQVPLGFVKDGWPESLLEFCHRSQAMRLVLMEGPPGVDPSLLPRKLMLKLGQKKQHEVCQLASLVRQECRALGITRVLDVGAGLGYLGRLLHHQYGLQVLGVEADGQKVDTASHRQLTCCPSTTGVTYVTGKVARGSQQFIRQSIQAALTRPAPDCSCGERWEEAPGDLAVCAVGLHVCGDLAPSTLGLFAALPELRSLVLVPCCHHKMSLDGDRSFPLSAGLKAAAEEAGLSRPDLLLRLASQETAARWRHLSEEDHCRHSFHVLSRAVLQLHAHQANLKLVKKRRRGIRRRQLHTTSFTEFLDDALERHDHVGMGGWDRTVLRAQLEQLWLANEGQSRATELLTALQVTMQAPAEHLVTADRLVYLQEDLGVEVTRVLRVTDDNVSPRCLVLVARKQLHS